MRNRSLYLKDRKISRQLTRVGTGPNVGAYASRPGQSGAVFGLTRDLPMLMEITSAHPTDVGTYRVKEINLDGVAKAARKGVTGTPVVITLYAQEANASAGIAAGTRVHVFETADGRYCFFRPVKHPVLWDGCCIIDQGVPAGAFPNAVATQNQETAAPLAAEQRLMVHLEHPVGLGGILVTYASLQLKIETQFDLATNPGGGWNYVSSGSWDMTGITEDFDYDGTRPLVGHDTWATQPTTGVGSWGDILEHPRVSLATNLLLNNTYWLYADMGWQGDQDISNIVGPFYGMMLTWIPPQILGVTFNAFWTRTTVTWNRGGVLPE